MIERKNKNWTVKTFQELIIFNRIFIFLGYFYSKIDYFRYRLIKVES